MMMILLKNKRATPGYSIIIRLFIIGISVFSLWSNITASYCFRDEPFTMLSILVTLTSYTRKSGGVAGDNFLPWVVPASLRMP
jgi:hypothetical protein